MHFRSTRRIRTEVSLYDPIGVDKEGNEIPSDLYLSDARFYWACGLLSLKKVFVGL